MTKEKRAIINKSRRDLIFLALEQVLGSDEANGLMRVLDDVLYLPNSTLLAVEIAWMKRDQIERDTWEGTDEEFNDWMQITDEILDRVEQPIVDKCKELYPN